MCRFVITSTESLSGCLATVHMRHSSSLLGYIAYYFVPVYFFVNNEYNTVLRRVVNALIITGTVIDHIQYSIRRVHLYIVSQ